MRGSHPVVLRTRVASPMSPGTSVARPGPRVVEGTNADCFDAAVAIRGQRQRLGFDLRTRVGGSGSEGRVLSYRHRRIVDASVLLGAADEHDTRDTGRRACREHVRGAV